MNVLFVFFGSTLGHYSATYFIPGQANLLIIKLVYGTLTALAAFMAWTAFRISFKGTNAGFLAINQGTVLIFSTLFMALLTVRIPAP